MLPEKIYFIAEMSNFSARLKVDGPRIFELARINGLEPNWG